MFWRKNGSGNDKVNGRNGLIQLREVTKVYQSGAGSFTALNRINLEIKEGEFVSIMGKSGSGKTTLINLLTGIDDPTNGEIIVGGTAVHRLREGEKASWRGVNMGVVFQFFQLLPTLTILENVVLPMDLCNMYNRSERNGRGMSLLRRVNLEAEAHQLPGKLSGGQQQRVAIARALANDPPIITTDEPTGNLDSHSGQDVIELFEDLVAEGKTILMVTHDDELAQRASRTIRIADGKIVN